MSVLSEKSRVILRSPAALAAAVPGLVGFTPEQSLVVVYLKDGLVVVTMRVDLPADLAEAAEHVVQTGTHVGSDELVLVVCSRRGVGDLPRAGGVVVISSVCKDAGIAVKDALFIDTGRYWSYLCTSRTCCPPEGTVVPEDASGLVAEAVGAGRLTPAATRADLMDRYRARPDLAPGEDAQAHAASLESLPLVKRAEHAWAAVEQLAVPGEVDDATDERLRAVIQSGMQAIHVRDYVLTQVARSESGTDALVDVVVRCALAAPESWRPRVAGAAAALLAACQGSSVAVEAVLEHAKGESLAQLVAVSVRNAVPPHLLRDTFAQAHPLVRDRLAENTPQ